MPKRRIDDGQVADMVREPAMKIGLDLRKQIRRQWGDVLPTEEEIFAAEAVMPAGYTARGIGWALPQAFGTPLGLAGQAVGTLISKVGEAATAELARKRQHEEGGEAARLTAFPMIVAVTAHRYILFYIDRSSERRFGRARDPRWLKPFAAHPPNWIRTAQLSTRIMNNFIRLEFFDGTSIELEAAKGMGDARGLVTAIDRLKALS
jgi:hypothetical protein